MFNEEQDIIYKEFCEKTRTTYLKIEIDKVQYDINEINIQLRDISSETYLIQKMTEEFNLYLSKHDKPNELLSFKNAILNDTLL